MFYEFIEKKQMCKSYPCVIYSTYKNTFKCVRYFQPADKILFCLLIKNNPITNFRQVDGGTCCPTYVKVVIKFFYEYTAFCYIIFKICYTVFNITQKPIYQWYFDAAPAYCFKFSKTMKTYCY